MGVYKIFTQFLRDGEVFDGSYTGEATKETVAARTRQHAAAFEASGTADMAGRRLNQRLLYDVTTLSGRHHLLATTCHVPQLLLAAIWVYTTCSDWPQDLADILQPG